MPRRTLTTMSSASRPPSTSPNRWFSRPPEARRPDRAVIRPKTGMVQVRVQRRRHQTRRFLSGN
ncbi:MAG TPA: hypothetical protein VGR90_02655 [Acidimicrobiales bacterium]|nr:hypothetical protein [Acidimicrobiales bacterium]